MFHHRQLLSALRTELQSNQPTTILPTEFDGPTCEQTVHASACLCRHAGDVWESGAEAISALQRTLHSVFGVDSTGVLVQGALPR